MLVGDYLIVDKTALAQVAPDPRVHAVHPQRPTWRPDPELHQLVHHAVHPTPGLAG